MDIGILGTGNVGRTFGAKLAELGHEVMLGTRDVAALMAREGGSSASFAEWKEAHPDVTVGTFDAAAAHGERVFNCTSGTGSLEALAAAGAEHLDGKILVDVANPLVFEGGQLRLSVANTDSLAEQIQRAHPTTRVVKALNTVNARLMVDPAAVADGEHHVFVCGDDAEARERVAEMLRDWLGWRNVVDLGDLTAARAVEMYVPLWARLRGAFDTPLVTVKVVSPS